MSVRSGSKEFVEASAALTFQGEDLPARHYEARYLGALAQLRKARLQTLGILVGGVVGGTVGVLVVHVVLSAPSTTMLGLCTGVGALVGAMLIAYLVSRRPC